MLGLSRWHSNSLFCYSEISISPSDFMFDGVCFVPETALPLRGSYLYSAELLITYGCREKLKRCVGSIRRYLLFSMSNTGQACRRLVVRPFALLPEVIDSQAICGVHALMSVWFQFKVATSVTLYFSFPLGGSHIWASLQGERKDKYKGSLSSFSSGTKTTSAVLSGYHAMKFRAHEFSLPNLVLVLGILHWFQASWPQHQYLTL